MEDILNTRQFESLIFEIRGFKVMIDADLAALYETETKNSSNKSNGMQIGFPEILHLN